MLGEYQSGYPFYPQTVDGVEENCKAKWLSISQQGGKKVHGTNLRPSCNSRIRIWTEMNA
jgi:hypothetical protein